MIYVANDVESGGPKLGFHPTLSIGAAMVVREELSLDDYFKKGLVFYAELIPDHVMYDVDSMRVGCSHLDCLEEAKKLDPQLDCKSSKFDPRAVIELMKEKCESPVEVASRFHRWLERFSKGEEVVGVIDMVFFDPGRLDFLFGRYCSRPSPFGWRGCDLTSMNHGYTRDPNAKLKNVGVPDQRKRPHRADEDAVYLAQIARVLLFERLGW